MGYQVYQVGPRFGGYGVPAYCEYPDCSEEIDRGVSFACGGEPFSELGCDRYFCDQHLYYTRWKCDGSDEKCDHEEECECLFTQNCKRCADSNPPFPYKPEHPTWMRWILKDESWEKWRKQNPRKVEEFKKELKKCETKK